MLLRKLPLIIGMTAKNGWVYLALNQYEPRSGLSAIIRLPKLRGSVDRRSGGTLSRDEAEIHTNLVIMAAINLPIYCFFFFCFFGDDKEKVLLKSQNILSGTNLLKGTIF